MSAIAEKIEAYLAAARGTKFSARWISLQIKEKQPAVSRQLTRMSGLGLIKRQKRVEFDMEYSRRAKRNIQCRRVRFYYWLDLL